MKRAVIALILALAALALLISLAYESRPLRVTTHVALSSIRSDLQRIEGDFLALVTTLGAAWSDQQAPGEGARALLNRVSEDPELLSDALFDMRGNASQIARLSGSHETFKATVDRATTLAADLMLDQTEYAGSVATLRDSGATVIREIRAAGLDRVAADLFQMTVGTLDYSGPNASVRAEELQRLLATLGRDLRVDKLPAGAQSLYDAVSTILAKKPLIESKLAQLESTPIDAPAQAFAAAAEDLYASATARIDRARLMLAVYAVLLLLAVGLIALRLHGSYRQLNAANAELAVLNESLEQRVVERTRELSGTLASLKESQVQLVQAEKMSSLGQLVAGISHEINTPLLYIANNTELVKERLAPLREFVTASQQALSIRSEQYNERTDYQSALANALRDVKVMLRDQELSAIVEEIEDLTTDSIAGLAELTEMAQSLKDFSRLDRAPVASFDVNAGLDKTLLIAKNIVKHKATVHKAYGDIPEIQCSPSKINQVFLNIITNAAQAIETQGEITITTSMRDDNKVAISVRDTGCGIPKENLSRIRDPFFTTKEVGTGTGLGLSIVDEIVRTHGGELLVESEVGKGSTFTVILPIRRHSGPTPGSSEDSRPLVDIRQLAEAV